MKGGTHHLSQYFNRFSIKMKILILVFTSIITGILLSYVSRDGLLSIERQLKEITLTTNVERSAYSSILHEKDYLLNSNGATYNELNSQNAFAEAKKNIEYIRTSLNEINGITSSPKLLTSSDSARKSADQYEEMYKQGVNQLVELNNESIKLEKIGGAIC
jgi:methyl-accepting chemotaxis protein